MPPSMTAQRRADIILLECQAIADEMVAKFTEEWYGTRGIPGDQPAQEQPPTMPMEGGMNG